MKKININLPQNGYDVFIGNGIFSHLLGKIKKQKLNKNLFFVIDSKVFEIYSGELNEIINSYTGKKSFIVVEASEKLKSFSTIQKIYNKLLEEDFSRDTLLIVIGGGIVGDISGFVAATFSRGIEYVQVPTTLLSTVDSSVGGKTGINFGNTKNIIGAFKQPKFVLIDPNFLETLNDDELLSGIGEVVKYAYLTEPKFYKYISKNIDAIFERKPDVIRKIISESVAFKGDVVVNDEKESGIRKMLNLGHTFAHAYEVVSKYKLKHGQAVIVGIASAIVLSERVGLVDSKKATELFELIFKFKNKIEVKNLGLNKLLAVMKRDKKNRNGKIKFVLLRDVGEIVLDVEASEDDVLFSLKTGMGIFS